MNSGNKLEFFMLDSFSLKLSEEDKKLKDDAFRKLKDRYKDYSDPWGFNIKTVKNAMEMVFPLYRNYFKVRVFGLENIQDNPYMIVSNHTGQIPIDGMLITMAFAIETEQPRVLHSMVERFMAGLPFIGDLSAQTGAILGDRDNCKWLLNKGESILVFPEGVRGINKSTKNFYQLQKFSNGFYRIALQAKTQILPISVVGAEEMFPFTFQAGQIGKKFGLPSLPIPTNLVPLPAPIDIYIGKPIDLDTSLSPDAPDKDIRKPIAEIENVIKENIAKGLESRREFLNWIRDPVNDLLGKI
jgi:1-acyl-sn-glycerol-3-phosphate acyltransferase